MGDGYILDNIGIDNEHLKLGDTQKVSMILGMYTNKRKHVEEDFYGLNQAPRMSYENI